MSKVYPINSITKGPRDSNFELLRIIAMFLVLVYHANGQSIGSVSYSDYVENPINALTRTLFTSISVICVNLFILISGWFGIKPSLKGFIGFLFQCIYIYGGIYLFLILIGKESFSLHGIGITLCLSGGIGWFVPSYMMLYILAPILNKFIESTSSKDIGKFLIAFYIFQTIYTYTKGTIFLNGGFTPISFMGLYVLARFIRNYKSDNYKLGSTLYIITTILLIIINFVILKFNLPINIYQYSDPFVIISSCGFLMWASTWKLKYNKYINWISSSSFAVYLFHQYPFDNRFFEIVARNIYEEYFGFKFLIIIFIFLVSTFMLGILFDKPRKWIWQYISELKIINSKFRFCN